MEIRYPNYYGWFRCLAGACPDTCCAGWEIPVDRESERRYRKAGKEAVRSGDSGRKAFAEKLRKHIRGGHIVSGGKYCPFLDHDGLCEMYQELGAASLCRTCRRHPRHVEDYGALHEVVLLLSCPEAARLILWENDGGYHVREDMTRTGNTDGIDGELLSALLAVRERIWERQMSIDHRMAQALALCHDVQGRLNREECGDIEKVLKRRGSVRAAGEENSRFLLMADFMECLAETDVICEDFMEELEQCRKLLYHSADSRARYRADRETFAAECPEVPAELENLFGYFIYSFFLGAVYDRDVLGKAKLAVLCTMAVEEMDLAAWRRRGAVGRERQIEICHGLARQVENSDENRARLERAMGKRRFSSRRMLEALCPNQIQPPSSLMTCPVR